MKRQPLKPVSKKRAAANREYSKVREVYLRENPECVGCLQPATEIHHICSGGCRGASLVNSDTWIAVCRDCHEWIQNFPKVEQVTLKVRHVLRTINVLRGRSPNAITLEDLR